MKKFYVEKLLGPGDWMYKGEYTTTREMAKELQYSPAKLNNFITDNDTQYGWHRIPGTEYRVHTITKD